MGLRQDDSQQQETVALAAWIPVLGIAAVMILLVLPGDTAREMLAYNRAAIALGEGWRLLTAHFVHLGTSHLILNLAGLALVWYLVGHVYSAMAWLVVWSGSILAVSAGLWIFEPQLLWYVGLSGVLHGLLAAGIINAPGKSIEIRILAVALVGKLAWEQLFGPLPGSEASSGGNVIVDAHLYGAVGGIIAALLIRVRAKASI